MTGSKLLESGIRAIADNLGEGLVVVQDGIIVFINDKLSELTGLEPQGLLNRKLEDLVPADHREWRYLEARERQEKGEVVVPPHEIRFRNDRGHFLEMRNRSTIIQWDGRPATVHFLEDITRKKETERLLTQQTAVNTLITDTVSRILASPLSLDETAGTVMDSAMGLTDSRSGILIIEDANGYRVVKNRCGDGCVECILPESLDDVLDDGNRMARSRPGRLEGSFYLNEPVPGRAECPTAPQMNNVLRVPVGAAGDLSGQIILADSKTPFGPWDLDAMEKVAEVLNLALVRHQAVEELRAAKETAEREAGSRSQFMANVTHEVRSPLNGVLMMASLLQDSGLNADQLELLGVVMFSARTIDRLIRDLTDINQIRAGKFRVYNAEFDLGELCRHILEVQKPEALRKGLHLDYSVAPGLSRFRGDRERTGQIISNLVTNAIRYTEKGHVRLELRMENGELLVSVSDTGPGIPPEKQQDVFRMFRRLDEHDRHSEGSGIGLAVVRELVEAMSGHIELDSAPGRGSVFSFYLPEAAPVETSSADRPADGGSDAPSVPRVLIVEDEGANRLYLRTLLEKRGCSVDEAFDGRQAIARARSFEYDLILMDINMPRMNGLEASAGIRESGNETPIVAITAHALGDDRFHILNAGLDDIVRKPFDDEKLNDCLKRYIRS